MLYVDEIQYYQDVPLKYKHWCHLWSGTNNADELLAFAVKIGLNPKWIQTKNKQFIHFDLTPGKRLLAIRNGAHEKSLKAFIKEQNYGK